MLTPSLVRAQEYTEEEYKIFQDIQAEKESPKKFDMILSFFKEHPKSGLRKNVIAEYQKMIVELQNEKNWDRIISWGDKFLSVVPNDDFTVTALAAAFSATNNTKGFATFGEKAYATKPSPQLAFAIARAYLSLGNDAKFLQFAEKGVAADPDNAEILAEMTRRYLTRQDMPKAVKYAKMCIQALPKAKKPENVSAQDWKNLQNTQYAAAYYALGAADYQNQNYNGAITNLDSAVKYYKRNDTAYYFLGMSYWQMNQLEPAMLNFAKAYILKGSTSSAAKKYLEQLWANSHRNSLAGVDRVIQRAQQDLK
jgi:tetratricopeptide (TPR) repeat protein